MKKLLFTLIILLAGTVMLLYKANHRQKAEINRLASNQSVLFSEIDFYRTNDSLSAASVERLTLTKKELEKYNAELTETVKALGIKVRRLEAASTTTTKTEVQITAPVRDSVVYHEQVPTLLQSFTWQDSWVSVSGIIEGGEVTCNVQSVDTLVQVIHRVPRQFWFIRWGTKAIRQEVISKNPHSEIVYTEYIELKK